MKQHIYKSEKPKNKAFIHKSNQSIVLATMLSPFCKFGSLLPAIPQSLEDACVLSYLWPHIWRPLHVGRDEGEAGPGWM